MPSSRVIHQPIHPDLRPHLDPEYVAFHDEHFQYILPSETTPWDPAVRTAWSPSKLAALNAVEVGKIEDVLLKHAQLRIFTPSVLRPRMGGWTLGNLDSDNGFCSRVAEGASCMAINVNYRHAPEDPYPAAVNDVMEALEWLASSKSTRLNIDRSQLTIGGTPAGGNLAAIASMKAALLQPSIPIKFQALILPVIDNTQTASTPYWASKPHPPWLTPSRMMWYRKMHLPNEKDCLSWDASPNLAPSEILKTSPKTWIAVSEHDLLAPEAVAFGEQLKGLGVEVEIKTYEGSTHSLLALSGHLSLGKLLVDDTISKVRHAFE
ncbi:lipase/ esterase [Mollisia scopiformis]|uniref:Lipase/ esterase n=1 Tax=Mollisia scopiformis TaxID=149040 RepID=A0A194X531_MOLSC|nr:lipase/ esterase [Mollisia scopiformis]KUJ15179.1 lipase/ esterase [Mollisia scopiformis]